MNSTIKKNYLRQLANGAGIYFLIVHVVEWTKSLSEYDFGRMLFPSIVGAIMFLIFNTIINALNFAYSK